MNNENSNDSNNETRKIIALVSLNGILCPIYEEPDEDTRREWSGN